MQTEGVQNSLNIHSGARRVVNETGRKIKGSQKYFKK